MGPRMREDNGRGNGQFGNRVYGEGWVARVGDGFLPLSSRG